MAKDIQVSLEQINNLSQIAHCKRQTGCYDKNMLARMAICGIFSLLLQLNAAHACRIIPTEKNAAKYLRNLVKGTPDIYWAEAVSYSKDEESFTFKVLETVRGEKKEQLVIGGQTIESITNPKLQELSRSDFKSHRMDEFWSNVVKGRTTLSPNCRLITTFEVGQKYLILLKTPFQTRSLELVKSKSDRWYKYVRETLYPPKIK